MSNTDIHYPAEFTDRLETVWGEGFLSPGGRDEVLMIMQGLQVTGRRVLDIGCGTGGVEVVLAGKLNAAHVTAIDVEPQLIERTSRLVERHQLQNCVETMLVKPGPLPLNDQCMDIVFSKDSLIHVPDKEAMFKEILRVLKPGGVFTASDWLLGEGMEAHPDWLRYAEHTHLGFKMATAAETRAILKASGFCDVSSVDRNEWYAELTVDELAQIEGPLRNRILEIVNQATYDHWVNLRRALRDATVAGALRPTHLRGFKAA